MNITIIPGIIFVAIIAIPLWSIGHLFPAISSPVVAILIGMIISFWKRPTRLNDGIRYSSRRLLQYSIILLGFSMNLSYVFTIGKDTLLLICITLVLTLVVAYFVGKSLQMNPNTSILIGVGTAICGGSAIAATAPVLQASDEEMSQAMATIFLFNIMAALVFPMLGQSLSMNHIDFGLWAGTAINDTSSVVAAGYSYSESAGNIAVIVKMTRSLMIIPITLILAFYMARKHRQTTSNFSLIGIFPWFILGFIGTSIFNTYSPLPESVTAIIRELGNILILMSMTAIGLNSQLSQFKSKGWKALTLGFVCWIVLVVLSLYMIQSISWI